MIRAVTKELPVRSVYREHAGKQFHWLEAGQPEAPKLLLVHGFMAGAMAFRRVIKSLGEHFHLIMPELPAHGLDQSFRGGGVQPTVASLVHWMRDFLEMVGTDVHIVGHSLGANVVYDIAREDDRVQSLTLVAPGLRIPPSSLSSYALDRFPARVAALAANRLGLALYGPLNWRGEPMTQIEAEAYLRPLREPERAAFMLKLGARLVEPRRCVDLAPIGRPTLVIWGERDHILPLEDAHWVAECLDSQLEIVAGSGHSPMEDCPAEFAKALLQFLESQTVSLTGT